MKSYKRVFRFLLQLLILVLVGGYLTTSIVQSTLASKTDKTPKVIITINSHGSFAYEGSLFGEELLYPATVEDAEMGIGGISGVVRINNQYKNVKVNNLGVGLDKNKLIIGNECLPDIVYNSFLDDVKLKIEKERLFTLEKTLVDYASIRELINGYELDQKDRFTINKGDIVDLKYTLHMVLEAGNELQSVTAIMPLYINVGEHTIIDDGNGDEDTDDRGVKYSVRKDGTETRECHWAHDCIITLLNHGVISGYPHYKYSIEDYFNATVEPVIYVNEAVLPDSLVTRAETAVLIGRALGLKEQYAPSTGYIDNIPNWARAYVIATTKANVFEGYPSGLFKPNNYITREEMIAVLTRAFNIILENQSLKLPFKDKDEIGIWAEEYVKAGYESTVIQGYPDNTYRPKNAITRAETFTIICKLMGWHEECTQPVEE